MKPKELRAGIVCSMFHRDLAQALLSGALKELAKASAGGGRAAGAPQTDGAGGGQPIDLLKPPDLKKLQKKGLNEPPIIIKPLLRLVPGAGEIPLMAQWMLKRQKVHGALALGAIIRGRTRHYDFLCSFLERALWDLQSGSGCPVVFSVLMLESRAQAAGRVKRGGEAAKAFADMLRQSQSDWS